ncbi:hypothetical protein D3C87_1254210 [compost metagenome]
MHHAAVFIEDDGRHREAADRLRIQAAEGFAAVEQRIHVQGPAQVRQQHGAHGPLGVTETWLTLWSIDPKTHRAAIRHADIGTEHVVTIVGLAVQQVKRRTGPLGIAHQFIDGEHGVGGQAFEQGGFGVVGEMVDPALPQFDITGDHHR